MKKLFLTLMIVLTACGGGKTTDDTVDCTENPDDSSCAGLDEVLCENAYDCDEDGLITSCDADDSDATNITPTSTCDEDGDGYVDSDGDDMLTCGQFDDNGDYVLDVASGSDDTDFEITYRFLCDNCPTQSNPEQTDVDADLVGDDCETTETICTDVDHDNFCDDGTNGQTDNCPNVDNPGQADQDGDLIGDDCDDDTDGDGIPNVATDTVAADNCTIVANADQKDTDGDLIGDACEGDEGDTDGDGILNETDECDTRAASDAYKVSGTDDTKWNGCCYDTDGDDICDIDELSGCVNVVNEDLDFDGYPDNCGDSDGDGTIDEEDTDIDGDGLKNDGDLCLQQADQWYLFNITKTVYDCSKYTCPDSCTTIYLNYRLNGDTIYDHCLSSVFSDEVLESETTSATEVEFIVILHNLFISSLYNYDYYSDESMIDDQQKAVNYEEGTDNCAAASYGSAYEASSTQVFCGFQGPKDSDSDGVGDACDPLPYINSDNFMQMNSEIFNPSGGTPTTPSTVPSSPFKFKP